MAIYEGVCCVCGNGAGTGQGIMIDERSGKCIICRRLDKIEKRIKELINGLYPKEAGN